ncbi:UDP-N-acetylglucosamine 2-epimerase (non-hydrolyzing) [Neptunomonas sp. XY-337]|uniref:non-hydrolyzing UDP-N-acetylglucosamine 2-epimerase n=1 Tax=Neptunomonas sp. XY-337 TaxID=2561897 RepID=UPI0010A9CE37|nr:UDP-N-acetylglucosamine 2-epimerase (non-hydrolyzing) [Neptunomonas sp. XY-337]
MLNFEKYRVICIVGARPNFMKIAPIMRALEANDRFEATLVHTGQHYDKAMKESFFEQLGIPEPDVDLGVGSGSHAVQTANIMTAFEPVMDRVNPHLVLVVGDVNSTIACALVAVKKGINVIHVESGLRSGDRAMPEEINRILTDQLSDLLFTTERSAEGNLTAEGIAAEKVHFVGNVMIDTLLYNLPRAIEPAQTFKQHLETDHASSLAQTFGLLTLHRPSNVDDPIVLERLLNTLVSISNELPLVFPVHPRTKAKIEQGGFDKLLSDANIHMLPPMGYLEMLGLMDRASVVLTDSGGIQEETTALGTPCLTLRENTERPITVDEGTNTIVGTDPDAIRAAFNTVMLGTAKGSSRPEYWDGKAAERIVEITEGWCRQQFTQESSE